MKFPNLLAIPDSVLQIRESPKIFKEYRYDFSYYDYLKSQLNLKESKENKNDNEKT